MFLISLIMTIYSNFTLLKKNKGDIKMTENERIIHNEKMIKLAKQAGASVLEYDDGLIVGYVTDSDYDTHAVDISNGLGYYDNDGYYRSF